MATNRIAAAPTDLPAPKTGPGADGKRPVQLALEAVRGG